MHRVLVVFSNWTYPGREGLHLQSAAVLQYLVAQGVSVHILAFTRDPSLIDSVRLKQEWGAGAEVTVLPLRDNYPLLVLRNLLQPRRWNDVIRAVQSWIDTLRPDVVHLEGIGLSPLVGDLVGAPVLLSTVDAWSLRQSRLARQARRMPKRLFLRGYEVLSRYVERRFFPRAQAVHVVSHEDASYLRALCPQARVVVVPVCLLSAPQRSAEAPGGAAERFAEPVRLVFWGDLGVDYLRAGLVWLLREVMPLVRARVGAALRLDVLGRHEPDAELQRCAGPDVVFHQWVPDVDGMLGRAAAVLLPDASGSGMKNRTLHAMACGVPVVGTRFAFEGFSVVDGRECYVRDDATGFAEAVTGLLSDRAAAQLLASRGRAVTLGGYSREAVAQQWLQLYESVAGRRHGSEVAQ